MGWQFEHPLQLITEPFDNEEMFSFYVEIVEKISRKIPFEFWEVKFQGTVTFGWELSKLCLYNIGSPIMTES